jgi:hypothetical protein
MVSRLCPKTGGGGTPSRRENKCGDLSTPAFGLGRDDGISKGRGLKSAPSNIYWGLIVWTEVQTYLRSKGKGEKQVLRSTQDDKFIESY